MPSTGEVMMVCSRLTCAWLKLACDWPTDAFEEFSAASDDCTDDCAESTAILAASKSACGSRCFASSCLARSYFCWASSSATRVRARFASDCTTSDCDLSTLALDCSSCAWRRDGSSRAINCSCFPLQVKSAPRDEM